MPWSPDDAERFKKGLSRSSRELWAEVANDRRERCLERGGSEEECDAEAVRAANAAVERGREQSGGEGSVSGDRLMTFVELGEELHEIQLARMGKWDHPEYGAFEITDSDLDQMVRNFEAGPLPERPVDYNHSSEVQGASPDAGQAAGWIKGLFKRAGALFARVEWTEKALEHIRGRQYRYISPVIQFKAKDKETGEPIGTRLKSAALVNQPFLEGMAPVSCSETTGERDALGVFVMAEWTTAYVNNLPDSSFAVIEPAYKSGDTENKSARHLPFKDADGKVDLPHLRNALARVNQIKPVTDSISAEELQERARSTLEKFRDRLETESNEPTGGGDTTMDEKAIKEMQEENVLLKADKERLEKEKKELAEKLAKFEALPKEQKEQVALMEQLKGENSELKIKLQDAEEKRERELEGVVTLAEHEQVKNQLKLAETRFQHLRRDIVLDEAIGKFKVAPAERPYWEKRYDDNPDETVKHLKEKPAYYQGPQGSPFGEAEPPEDLFLKKARKKAAEEEISLSEAMNLVSKDEPDLAAKVKAAS